MSGHSKWANIKHRKAAQDNKRGKVFQKLSKEITISAKQKGANPDINTSLRLLLLKAKSSNMPKSIIEKALNKSQSKDQSNWEEITYEGYGTSGSAFIVKCLSDNRNRVASFVKSTFRKFGGNLGSDGAVKYLFTLVGYINVSTKLSEDDLVNKLLELDIENYQEIDDGEYMISTTPNNLSDISTALSEDDEIDVHDFGLEFSPNELVQLPPDKVATCQKLRDTLMDNEDISEVFCNVKIEA